MRYLLIVLGLFVSFFGNAQSQGVTNAQTKLRPNQLRWSPTDATLDSVYIIRADTATGEPGWYLVTLGGSGGGVADTTLSGDVIGGLNSTFVRKINGVTVENKTPQGREVLQYNGTQWTPDSIDLADLPQMNASRLLGRGSTTSGAPEQLTAGTGLRISSNVLETHLTAGTGIVFGGGNPLQIINSAPDQPVSIIGGGINTVSGTYPNFTVTGTEVDGSITNEIELPTQNGNNGKYLTTNGSSVSWNTVNATINDTYNTNDTLTQNRRATVNDYKIDFYKGSHNNIEIWSDSIVMRADTLKETHNWLLFRNGKSSAYAYTPFGFMSELGNNTPATYRDLVWSIGPNCKGNSGVSWDATKPMASINWETSWMDGGQPKFEWHEHWKQPDSTVLRLKSYTITYANALSPTTKTNIDLYHTADQFYVKSSSIWNSSPTYFSVSKSKTSNATNLTLEGGSGASKNTLFITQNADGANTYITDNSASANANLNIVGKRYLTLRSLGTSYMQVDGTNKETYYGDNSTPFYYYFRSSTIGSGSAVGVSADNTTDGTNRGHIKVSNVATTMNAYIGVTSEGGNKRFYINSTGGDNINASIISKNVTVGTTYSVPQTNAQLTVSSTSKGFMPPVMTTAQRNAVTWVAGDAGMMIYCTDCTATDASTGVSQTWNGSAWKNHY